MRPEHPRPKVALFSNHASNRGDDLPKAKAAVPGHFNRAIVALKIPVVELMKEIPHHRPFPAAHHKLIKAGMRKDGMYRLHISVKQHVDRMARHDKVDQEIRVEQQLLQWMH